MKREELVSTKCCKEYGELALPAWGVKIWNKPPILFEDSSGHLWLGTN